MPYTTTGVSRVDVRRANGKPGRRDSRRTESVLRAADRRGVGRSLGDLRRTAGPRRGTQIALTIPCSAQYR